MRLSECFPAWWAYLICWEDESRTGAVEIIKAITSAKHLWRSHITRRFGLRLRKQTNLDWSCCLRLLRRATANSLRAQSWQNQDQVACSLSPSSRGLSVGYNSQDISWETFGGSSKTRLVEICPMEDRKCSKYISNIVHLQVDSDRSIRRLALSKTYHIGLASLPSHLQRSDSLLGCEHICWHFQNISALASGPMSGCSRWKDRGRITISDMPRSAVTFSVACRAGVRAHALNKLWLSAEISKTVRAISTGHVLFDSFQRNTQHNPS